MENESDVLIKQLKRNLLELAEAIADGTVGKIHGIKAYRAATGEYLKESKDWFEAREHKALLTKTGFEDSRIQRLEDRVSLLEACLNRL